MICDYLRDQRKRLLSRLSTFVPASVGASVTLVILILAAAAPATTAGERQTRSNAATPPPSRQQPSPKAEQSARTDIVGPDAIRRYDSLSPPPPPSTELPLTVIVLPPARTRAGQGPVVNPVSPVPVEDGDDLVALSPGIPGLLAPEDLAVGRSETHWNDVRLPSLSAVADKRRAPSPISPSLSADGFPAGTPESSSTFSIAKDWVRRAEPDILAGSPVSVGVPATGATVLHAETPKSQKPDNRKSR